jgi:Raf kinase inhibitor-like YbhB/YbcL family protein
MKKASRSLLALATCAALAGVAIADAGGSARVSFTLRSPAFGDGDEIPARHTCDGDDVSPPLEWSAPPAGSRSLALVVDDPDAPDPRAPRMTWVHWVVVDLPPAAGSLPEGVTASALSKGARTGRNDWKRAGYGGPCPPIGRHRYFHKLYALDVALPALASPTKAELERAIEGHVLAEAVLIGTYQKLER